MGNLFADRWHVKATIRRPSQGGPEVFPRYENKERRISFKCEEEFYDCSYLPLQRILPGIVTEELGHIEYGYNKTLELLSKGDEQKERVQKAIEYWYVRALDIFGRGGSKRCERYRYWGLKRRSNEQAQEYQKEGKVQEWLN